jgi:hypothetical protein
MPAGRVTLNFSSGCDSPLIHQTIFLQLSIGNTWVPLDGVPIRVPPTGSPSEVNLRDVAQAAADALRAASVRTPVSNVSGPTPASAPKSGLGATFAVSFDVEDVDQIDFGAVKAPGGVADTQLVITPVMPPGITAKEIPAKFVKTAGQQGGWGKRKPKDKFHNTIRWPAGPNAAVGPYGRMIGVPDPVGGGGYDEWVGSFGVLVVEGGTHEARAFPAWPENEVYWAHAHHVPSLSALTSPLAEPSPIPARSVLAAASSPLMVAAAGPPRPSVPMPLSPHGALPPGLRMPADPV